MTTTEGESKGNYEGINVRSYSMKEGYSMDANMGVCTKINHSCCPCQLLAQHALYSIQCPCGLTATSMTCNSWLLGRFDGKKHQGRLSWNRCKSPSPRLKGSQVKRGLKADSTILTSILISMAYYSRHGTYSSDFHTAYNEWQTSCPRVSSRNKGWVIR